MIFFFHGSIWGFPEIRGTLFGGPYSKDYSMLGYILGSPYFGKLPYPNRPKPCFLNPIEHNLRGILETIISPSKKTTQVTLEGAPELGSWGLRV